MKHLFVCPMYYTFSTDDNVFNSNKSISLSVIPFGNILGINDRNIILITGDTLRLHYKMYTFITNKDKEKGITYNDIFPPIMEDLKKQLNEYHSKLSKGL